MDAATEILPEYKEGLGGLEEFSRIVILAYLHKPQGRPLVVMSQSTYGGEMRTETDVRPGGGSSWARLVPTAFAVDFVGIGGRFLVVPALLFSTGLDILKAVGTSLISVGTFGMVTAAAYLLRGLVEPLNQSSVFSRRHGQRLCGSPGRLGCPPEDVAENIRRGVDRRGCVCNG